MPNILQVFLADSTRKAARDLEAALLRLPEEKRHWTPMGPARTAADMVAECAILNGTTAEMLKSHTFPADHDFGEFLRAKAELVKDWQALQTMLHTNTAKVIEVIQNVPEADLGIEVALPWGPATLAQISAYPYWNMSYHEGQINYIASMLDLLK